MADPVIRLRATDETAAAFTSAAANADRLGRNTAKLASDFKAVGPSVAQVNAAMRTLPAQFTDIATQLAGGQSPFLILLQQGGQIKDSFGGIGPTITNLAKLITPVRVLIGGTAAAAAGLAYALYDGAKQSEAFNRAILVSGNRAGVTAGQFERLVTSISASTKVSSGTVREVAQAAVASGQIGPQALGKFTEAITLFADRSGQSAESVTKDFLDITKGATTFAIERNKSLNFLTVEQVKYIRSLEQQGETQKAQIVIFDALTERFRDKQPAALGYLGERLRELTILWQRFYDAAANLGRPDTTEDKIRKLQQTLAGFDKDRLNFPNAPENPRAAEVRAQIASLQELAKAEADAATQKAADAQRNNTEILKLNQGYQSALLDQERAGFDAQLAIRARQRAIAEIDIKASYDFGPTVLTQAGYVKAIADLRRQDLDDQEASINRSIELERRRPLPDDEGGRMQAQIAVQARVTELEQRRNDVLVRRRQLQDDLDRGNLAGTPRATLEDPKTQLRQLELAQTQATEQGVQQRQQAAREAANDLRQTNRQLNVDLIRDDVARAQAQFEIDTDAARKRADSDVLNVKDRADAEAAFTDNVLLRQQQLTEQLKPEYQKMLEYWQDTTRLMRDSFNDFALGFQKTGEDVFVEFAKTGKLNVKSLVDFTVAELAKLQYRKFLAGGVQKGVDFLGGLLGLTGGSGSTGSSLSNAPTDDGLLSQFLGGNTPSRFLDPSGQRGASALAAGSGNTTINVAAGVTRNEVTSAIQTGMRALKADIITTVRNSKGNL